MDKEFDIEIQDENIEANQSIQLPMNFLTFGEIENDDVKVYIKQDVYKALEKLAASDTSKELGSIILGDYCQELGKTNVIISQFIEAKYTDASASTLTFTHETWDYVHREHEKKYLDKKIIGWQHTHPNYGIFLSNYDLFIQENFFNMPFQVAYVIDPIQNIRGFFQWKNGKIEKLKGYYIYDDIGKPIKIEQTKTEKKPVKIKPSRLVYATTAVLCMLCVILCGIIISMKNTYQTRLDSQEEMVNDIKTMLSEQNETIKEQADAITTLQGYFVDGILDGSGETSAVDLITKLENHEIKLENQEELLEELKAYLEENDKKENEVNFIIYTVESGDSLSLICQKVGISYSANNKIILSMNGIDEPNKIYVGQNLLLPSIKE